MFSRKQRSPLSPRVWLVGLLMSLTQANAQAAPSARPPDCLCTEPVTYIESCTTETCSDLLCGQTLTGPQGDCDSWTATISYCCGIPFSTVKLLGKCAVLAPTAKRTNELTDPISSDFSASTSPQLRHIGGRK
jgi:hypothetical protein